MATFCNKCGTQAVDDESAFCKKCGNSLPENQPKKTSIVSKTVNQISDSKTHSYGVSKRPGRNTGKKAKSERTEISKFFSFEKFITRYVVPKIYILGAIAITLISLSVIVSGFLNPDPSISSVNNTILSPIFSANNTFLSPISSAENPFISPLIWICILVFGNIFWRITCEICIVLFKINDTLITIENTPVSEEDTVDYVECPHCLSDVRKDQLRECDSCGVVGCEKCIRMSGLVQKTMTCKSCFENK